MARTYTNRVMAAGAHLLVLCLLVAPAHAETVVPGMFEGPAAEPSDDVEEELRRHLTTRVDKRRPLNPRSYNVRGRPLTMTGEYEAEGSFDRELELGERGADNYTFLEQGVEIEAYYGLGLNAALFMQGEMAWEQELHKSYGSNHSRTFFEREESWLYLGDLGGSGLNFEAGRLHFEDTRRWWWDDELDSVRVSIGNEAWSLGLTAAQDQFSTRSDQSYIDPEREDVFRMLAHAAWRYRPNHRLGLYALTQSDGSDKDAEGKKVSSSREDESDADLTWYGARLSGSWNVPSSGSLDYWVDAAALSGRESFTEYDDEDGINLAGETSRHSVDGWGFDTGMTWTLPTPLSPRFTLGYAVGSGSSSSEENEDRSFRQTGLQGNEASFGAVRRFNTYGVLLEPELSNLKILTAGFGLSVLDFSSIDVVYHDYRLSQSTTFLRDTRLDGELTGRKDVGQGLDLVLSLQEWKRFEVDLTGSLFQPGSAFEGRNGDTTYGAGVAFRYNF